MPDTDASNDVDAWLWHNAHRLNTLDPDAPDDSDLAPLGELIGDARVVMIGESMHRIHEFYQFRHRVFRYLAREHGFSALVMESGFPEGVAVDQWIRGGSERVRSVLENGLTYHMGKCQEMLDQLGWMREYNSSSARPVRFYGMDLPGSSATALSGVLACLPVLDQADPHYADVVRGALLPLFDYLPEDRRGLAWAAPAIQSYLALPQETRFELTARITELVERMQAMRVHYAESIGAAEAVETALRCAVTARHADAFLAAMINGPTRRYPPANIRDAAMAENLEWILQREDRIVVVAANGHVQKAPFLAPPFVTEGMSTVGEHLAARFGPQMVVIGCTYGGGEAWLHRPAPDSLPGHSVPFVEDVGASHAGSLDALLGTASPATS